MRLHSGRPKGRKNNAKLEIEEARTILRELIFKQIEPIAKAQLDLATGLWYEDVEKGRVYRTKPDKGAAALLLAHSIGKPIELEHEQEEIVLMLDIEKITACLPATHRLTLR
jgi:hypothetical protein